MAEDWWNTERKRHEAEQLNLMRYLRITLYGSFFPDLQKKNLEAIVDYLVSKGFFDCDLVEGKRRPIEGFQSNFEACAFYLDHSDLNFLTFTRDGKRLGVTTELDHVLDSPLMYQKWACCVVLDQQSADGTRGSLGPLQIGRLSELNSDLRTRVYVVPFQDFEQLKEIAYRYAKDQFIAMRPELGRRSLADQAGQVW